ncbi:hypothetical protein SLEP1_g17004 [Rubroshorea leprosula]|uniref:Uncharacterized protein n=1 Tax=Rubroshorea leprosula TaxID=152421 RepID=A0AAV5ISR5_9ROSI|nr:hypothetical protein SLEP1_g17004 [Rubroshorea leprosula]
MTKILKAGMGMDVSLYPLTPSNQSQAEGKEDEGSAKEHF